MGIYGAAEVATCVKIVITDVKDPPYTEKIICGKNY